MKWIKTIIIGVLATFSMDLVMNSVMYMFEFAPTNLHPSAALLYNLNIDQPFLASFLHYCYGTLWAIVFVYANDEKYTLRKAILLAGVLWVFMMLVYSPVIGWGFLGIGNAVLLDTNHPLYISTIPGYIALTFVLHIIYGLVLGLLTSRYLKKQSVVPTLTAKVS